MQGSWIGRGNQYIYSLSRYSTVNFQAMASNDQLSPLEVVLGTEPRLQRWEARVLPLCHRDPVLKVVSLSHVSFSVCAV